LGAGGFFAAGGGTEACAEAAAGGRGVAAAVPDGAGRAAGSGAMMLTAGVDAALGNSALVGLPVGTDGGSPAIAPGIDVAGAFQEGA
jgi:hypothetical protein